MTLTCADLVQRAAALRDAQQMEEALDAITCAAKISPNDPRILFGLAQISFETWRPAADHFAAARRLLPDNPDLIRNHALALSAQGEDVAAQQLLQDVLAANPGWIDGHKTFATLRVTAGSKDKFDDSYRIAVTADPSNLALRMAWFQHHAIAKSWAEARAIIAAALNDIGPHQNLNLAELCITSESGDGDPDFAPYEALGDPGTDLCHVRHLLQNSDALKAETIASRHMGGASARIFWPYLSLCWQLQGDKRADWLNGAPIHARTFDLEFSRTELTELAKVLRGLHRLKSPYPEQSVRGGTQTDRQIFFHPSPAIQAAKAKTSKAVEQYIHSLPPHDATHPLLAYDRTGAVLFAGSWSVRLTGAGYHSSHTHVMGCISSAFYICVPPQSEMGSGQSGWLALGSPPPELRLDLKDHQRIAPKPGRLALFPSTMWHSTLPIESGERMTIAFDVKIPR